MHIKNCYKIHALSTANGVATAPNGNNTFYETYGEAKAAAESYASRGDKPASMVIYRAIEVVSPAPCPTVSRQVRGDGSVELPDHL